jgi:tetratricopeptide (TPR) repeat protein
MIIFFSGCHFELFKPHQDPFYAAMLASDRNNPAALFAQGRLLLSQGRYQEAENYFSRLVKLAPNHVAGWNALGRTRLELGRFKGAQTAFERQWELQQSQNAQLGLGESLLMQGNLKDALRSANLVEKQFGPGAGLARLRGDIAFRERKYSEAAKFYEESLERNPDQAGLNNRLKDIRDFLSK